MLLELPCVRFTKIQPDIVRGRDITAHFFAPLHRLKPVFISSLHSQKPSCGFVIGAPRTEKLSLLMPKRQEYITF